MGWFTKNTMDLIDMKDLTSFTAASILESFDNTGAWPGPQYRTNAMNAWLSRSGHKASFLKTSKLALCADAVARHLQAMDSSSARRLTQGDDAEQERLVCEIDYLSNQILMEKGMTQ